jgi:hypothetical protein
MVRDGASNPNIPGSNPLAPIPQHTKLCPNGEGARGKEKENENSKSKSNKEQKPLLLQSVH